LRKVISSILPEKRRTYRDKAVSNILRKNPRY
jgi:hypothetical protein